MMIGGLGMIAMAALSSNPASAALGIVYIPFGVLYLYRA